MKRIVLLGAFLVTLLVPRLVSAQPVEQLGPVVGGNPLGTVGNPLVTTGGGPASAACKTWTVNADTTVDATAGGTQVVAAGATRCGLTLVNTGAGDARCTSSAQTPTASFGIPVTSGAVVTFGAEAALAVKCIRTAAVNATITTVEVLP